MAQAGRDESAVDAGVQLRAEDKVIICLIVFFTAVALTLELYWLIFNQAMENRTDWLARVLEHRHYQAERGGGQGDGQHQRQDDRVLAGQLEHDQHGGDGGAGRAREHRTHADQGVGARRRRQMRVGGVQAGWGA